MERTLLMKLDSGKVDETHFAMAGAEACGGYTSPNVWGYLAECRYHCKGQIRK